MTIDELKRHAPDGYALISKEDREQALRKQGTAVAAMMCLDSTHEQFAKEAQVLLQLIPPDAKKAASLRVTSKQRRARS